MRRAMGDDEAMYLRYVHNVGHDSSQARLRVRHIFVFVGGWAHRGMLHGFFVLVLLQNK